MSQVKNAEGSRKVRVRYAPSPTGIPHIGNIRTALFNYLFAKNQKGVFILRIEDTDRTRLVPGAVEKIKESLRLLNIEPDTNETYLQSKRLNIYQKHLEILKKDSLVYEDEGAWRFKVEKGKKLKWKDLVHGEISFDSDVIEDFIIIKSDGYPTYHFASVVDDHDMQISHVFRGDEWISSTPKHLLLYQAFGWEAPAFVHLPPILGSSHKKLSKREGAKSVMDYLGEGYLPEALVNFMAFLGWAPKDNREIFSLDDLIKDFSLERINKNSPIFNLEKLKWFNGQWIRRIDINDYIDRLTSFYPNEDQKLIKSNSYLVKDRISTLADYKEIAGFFGQFDANKFQANLSKIRVPGPILSKIAQEEYSKVNWAAPQIRAGTVSFAQDNGIEPKDLFSSIGIAVSGSTVTPPLFESLEKLGREETVTRLVAAGAKKKGR